MPSPSLRDKWTALLTDDLADFDWRGLRAALATWDRWAKWCQEERTMPTEIEPVRTALFLNAIRSEGPTAAKGVWGKLYFLELHLGLPLGCKNALVKSRARVSKHVANLAGALLARDVLFLLAWLRSSNEVVAFAASAVLCVTSHA